MPPGLSKQIGNIDKTILAAGTLFKEKEFEASAKKIRRAQKSMAKLTKLADAKTLEAVDLTYRKLAKAHGLLTKQGEKLRPLAALPEPKAMTEPEPMTEPAVMTNGKISFVSQVAPILVSKCGNCHVNNNRGNFSAATFRNLDNSAMIAYGVADESRLIETIESGEMPKGNLKVTDGELAILKQWINQGAKFDGPNQNVNLASFAAPKEMMGRRKMPKGPDKPTGDETVSFGLHIAPILLANCAQCHISRNPRGDFNLASFAMMLRGGDSGQAYTPGRSAKSEIILRLKGQDRNIMPPAGKLDDKSIALVAKWIDEGAKFDPADVRLPMSRVAAKGFANSLDHDELSEHRVGISAKTWKLALSDVEPSSTSTENFLVVGTGSTKRLEDVAKAAESIAERVGKILNTASVGGPFVKGDTSIFVVDKRYDFAEYGRMVEKRSFARHLVSSWQSDTVVANVGLLYGIKDDLADYEVSLARDIASVHVANFDASVPRWFADGMGHWVAENMFKRHPLVVQWNKDSLSAMASMKNPNDFLGKNMAADQAALVGFRFVQLLENKGLQFKRLIRKLREDEKGNFDSAFHESYGITPGEFFQRRK